MVKKATSNSASRSKSIVKAKGKTGKPVKKEVVASKKVVPVKSTKSTKNIAASVSASIKSKKGGKKVVLKAKKSTKFQKKVSRPSPVVAVESDNEDSNTQPTTSKQNKKISKGKLVNSKKHGTSGATSSSASTKGRDARSTTPVKSSTAIAQKKKAKKTEDQKLDMPDEVADVVRQVVIDHKSEKLSADKIVSLIQEDYKNVCSVAVHTAIGKLYRTGLLSESRSFYTVDESILAQLQGPAPAVVEEPVVVPAADATAIEEEAPIADAEAIATEEPAATEEVAADGEAPAAATIASARKSAAKDESAKKSVARLSATKDDAPAAIETVINTEEADALKVLGESS